MVATVTVGFCMISIIVAIRGQILRSRQVQGRRTHTIFCLAQQFSCCLQDIIASWRKGKTANEVLCGRIFLGCKFSQILFLIIIMLHNFNYPIPYLLTIQSIFMLCVEGYIHRLCNRLLGSGSVSTSTQSHVWQWKCMNIASASCHEWNLRPMQNPTSI